MDDSDKSFYVGIIVMILCIFILVSLFIFRFNSFSSGCFVALTFDDGFYEQYDAMLWLNETGIDSTLYYPSNLSGEIFEEYYPIITWNEVNELQRWGNEIGSHGMNHINLDDVGYEEARYDLIESINQFKEHGIEINSYGPPYGSGVDYHENLSEYVDIIRPLGWDFITEENAMYEYETLPVTEDNFDDFVNSVVFNNLDDYDSNKYQGLILVFHRVVEDVDDDNYPFRPEIDISFDNFEYIVNSVEEMGCEFVRVDEIPGVFENS